MSEVDLPSAGAAQRPRQRGCIRARLDVVFGRTPGGAQARLGILTRPKRPSSSAIFSTGLRSRGSRVASAA